MNKRYFKPNRKYVMNTLIPVSVEYWIWTKGRGLFVKYLHCNKQIKSDWNTLREFQRAIKEGREFATEVESLD